MVVIEPSLLARVAEERRRPGDLDRRREGGRAPSARLHGLYGERAVWAELGLEHPNLGLEASGDQRLVRRMVTHLRLAVWPSPDGAILDEFETAVLQQLLPPLNVAKVSTPWRTTVQTSRRRLAAHAEAWAAGRGEPT